MTGIENCRASPVCGFALAASLVLVAAMPASGSARTCDRLGGKTLAANTTLRLYRTAAFNGTVSACAYATRRHRTLGGELKRNRPNSYVINGNFAALVLTRLAPKEETRDSGVSYTQVIIWDARTNKLSQPQSDIMGVHFVTDRLSPTGVFAGLGVAYGNTFSPDLVQTSPPTAQIARFDPNTTPLVGSYGISWQVIATDPVSITDLAASATTLYWTQANEPKSAPFTAPAQ